MYYEQYTLITWLVVPCYILVIVMGTFGNIVVLKAYLTSERVWNRSYNLILCNGVIADLIICSFFTPLLLIHRSNASARLIEISPICEMSLFSSTFAISLQYVVFPLFALNRRDVALNIASPFLTLPKCRKLLAAGWFICIAVSATIVVLLRSDVGNDVVPMLHRCILVNTRLDTFTMFFLFFSAPLYAASVLVAFKCYRDIRSVGSQDLVLSLDDERRTKMCKIVAVVYTVFWSPFLFVQIFGIFGPYSELIFNLHAASSAIGVFASAVNPYLYSYMDHYYRKKFINIFKFTMTED